MTSEDRYTKHARLVSKMADRAGVDVVENMQRGELNSEELRTMVHRCEGCTDPEACERLLESGAQLDNVPSYCRNADRFDQLKS